MLQKAFQAIKLTKNWYQVLIALSDHTIYYVQKELKLLKGDLMNSLTQGVDKIEDYKYILGKIHMLDICQQEISRLLEKEETFDD